MGEQNVQTVKTNVTVLQQKHLLQQAQHNLQQQPQRRNPQLQVVRASSVACPGYVSVRNIFAMEQEIVGWGMMKIAVISTLNTGA